MTRATMVLALASVACGGDAAGRLGPREDAYRANNRGIARLEQFDYPAAAAAFRDARSLDDTLGIARVNLALALYYGYLGSSWVDVIAEWTATWTSKAINLFGGSTTVSGTLLISDNFVANVVAECTAIGPIILYIGAVVAYPASKRAKLAGVAAGVVVLTAVNLVRIISLFWIGEAYPEYLDVVHLLVWQSVIILLAIIMWLLWAGRLSGAAQR